jgi:branched-chain amino acid transport system substrate-binding protein
VTFGTDLVRFVREGNTRGFFKGKAVVSALTGEPEYLDTLKEETPEGWIVTGYPWQSISEPDHVAFRKAYEDKFKDYPRWGSVLGYTTYMALAGAIRAAGSTDGEKITDAFRGLTFKGPLGPVTYRAADHQSTISFFVGKLTKKDGNGLMTDWQLVRGEDYLPPPDVAAALRPKD